jgi:hypothetical protein
LIDDFPRITQMAQIFGDGEWNTDDTDQADEHGFRGKGILLLPSVRTAISKN